MNFGKLSTALSAATLLLSAASLQASPLSFTWTAFVLPDSNLDGQTFSGEIVFSGNSDTDLAQPNPVVTNGPNYGFNSVGPVDFFIPSLNATGTLTDTANILSFSIGLLKFNLTPNGVNSDAGDLLFSNPGQIDLFDTSQVVTGSQFVEGLGAAAVSNAVINGVSVSNTILGLDTDPTQNATFVEIVGAPEPGSWTTLLAGAVVLLTAARARRA